MICKNSKMKFYKLPDNALPIHYEIFITPNLSTYEYTGKEKIFIDVLKPTRTITLNSIDIKIKSASYNSNNSDILVSQNIEYNISDEIINIHFAKEISVEKNGFLSIEFEGKINEKLSGFYRSRYISNGLTKLAGVTQFAPTDARQCFPCWDEPGIKSTFSISLIIAQNLLAISNMPIQSTTTNNSNLTTVSFLKTPLMSSYLVAFIICDYEHIIAPENKKIRLYAPKNNVNDGEFSLGVAVKALSFYENYFKIEFPLPKIDLVSVADFSYGAMENWGLITFREANLLVDSQNSSTIKKQKAALTVAHELAHQWFGNLVTMEWWTHLWLNEGYASFMEYLCIDHIYPEYNIWAQFLISIYIKALELDALANTHPIEVPIEKPSQIREIFDEISYSKGASVIRMIHSYIGKDDFQKGMYLYLMRHSYLNVNTDDLWHALEEASKKPIGKIMSTWTKQSGFPLITVTEKVTNNSNRVFTFSQEKFYINGSIDNNNTTWIIPITLSSALGTENILQTIILDEKTKDIEIKNFSHESWFKVNAGSIGFFRTLYSTNLLNKLLSAIQNHSLPAFDRLGLLDDLFTIAQSGRVSTVEFLKVLIEFKNENEYIVWSCIINNLRKINHILLEFEDISKNFKIFGKNILYEIHRKLGWTTKEDENHLDTLLRISVLSQLADFEDKNILHKAQKLFEMHFKKQSILPADFRSFVYQAVLSVGDIETFKQIMSLYKETTVHEEKNRILSSLGAINNSELLQKILEFSLTDEVRTQDVAKVFRSVANNHKGRLLAWQYFKKNWSKIINCCYSGTLLTNIIESVTENFVTEEIIYDIQDFFNKTPALGSERTVRQCIETIRLNTAWLNRDKKSIENFLILNIKEIENFDS